MPAYSSHYLFAKELMTQLKEKTAGIQLNESAVILGTQGPDIFFFHRILPVIMHGKSRRKVGSAMHRAMPSKIFDAMCTYVNSLSDKSIAYSYAVGFLCHYSLDRIGHPFVYALQKRIQQKNPRLPGFTVHNTIEFSLDNLMLNYLMGIEKPYEFDTFSTVPNSYDEIMQISKMLEYVIANATKEKINQRDIVNALIDFKNMQYVLHDNKGKGTALLVGVEDLLTPFRRGFRASVMLRPRDLQQSMKYGNLCHGVWRNPNKPEEKRKESFIDLFNKAKDDCLNLVENFNVCLSSGESMSEATGEISFLTGVKVN